MGKFLDSKLVSDFLDKNADTFINAVDFTNMLIAELRGKDVPDRPHVFVNGVECFTPGEKAAKRTADMIHKITPTQWKRLGVLALTLAGCKIPILATVDWNKVMGVAEALQKGGPKTLVNQVDWRGLSNNLIAQKAEAAGVSNETIDEMLNLVNGIIDEYHVPEKSTSEIPATIPNCKQIPPPKVKTYETENVSIDNLPKATMFCTGCGKGILRSSKFCTYCGAKVTYGGSQ